MKRYLLALLALAGCTAAPAILPEPPIEAAPVETQGQSAGWCTEYTLSTCEPNDAAARAICVRLYGDTFDKLHGFPDATAMECFDSIDAAMWGCLPACGFSITCPGAPAAPSDLWCCPW